jgi:hypothetical protein
MHQYPKKLGTIVELLRAQGYDPSAGFAALAKALAHPALKKSSNTESGITCELCRNDAWWQENFGSGWELVQWWYCGPLGLDCNQGG